MDPDAAERYLRLLAEHVLAPAGDGSDPGPDAVAHAGAALAASGLVAAATVEAVLADLRLARELRRVPPDTVALVDAFAAVPAAPDGPAPSVPPAARSVALGPASIPTADGLLHVDAVTFGPDGATLIGSLDGDGPVRVGPRRPVAGSHGPSPALHPSRLPAAVRLPPAGRAPRPPRTRAWSEADGADGPERGARRRPPPGPDRGHVTVSDDQGRQYRLGRADVVGGGRSVRVRRSVDPVPPAGTRWLELSVAGSPPQRLHVTPPRRDARGRPHGRSRATAWLLGALHRRVAERVLGLVPPATGGDDLAAVTDGVTALRALGALGDDEPLLRQAALLGDDATSPDDLDPRLGSPLAAVGAGPTAAAAPARAASWPIATVVDLGDRTARLDALTLRPDGLRLLGVFAPWPEGDVPGSGWLISAFDDRHNQYVALPDEAKEGPGPVELAWHLGPTLDPSARRLRLSVAGPDLEASVEIVVGEAGDRGGGR